MGVREGSRIVMKARFLLMIFVEGNDRKVMVLEIECGGMDAVVRAKASVVKMSELVDSRGVLKWKKLGERVSELDDSERLDASWLRLRWGCEVGGGVVECMLR